MYKGKRRVGTSRVSLLGDRCWAGSLLVWFPPAWMPLVAEALDSKNKAVAARPGTAALYASAEHCSSIGFKLKRWHTDRTGLTPILHGSTNALWFSLDPTKFVHLFPTIYEGMLSDVYCQKIATAWEHAAPTGVQVSLLLPSRVAADDWLYLIQSHPPPVAPADVAGRGPFRCPGACIHAQRAKATSYAAHLGKARPKLAGHEGATLRSWAYGQELAPAVRHLILQDGTGHHQMAGSHLPWAGGGSITWELGTMEGTFSIQEASTWPYVVGNGRSFPSFWREWGSRKESTQWAAWECPSLANQKGYVPEETAPGCKRWNGWTEHWVKDSLATGKVFIGICSWTLCLVMPYWNYFLAKNTWEMIRGVVSLPWTRR